MLVNNKEKFNILEKNGVYEIQCAEYDATYIGQCAVLWNIAFLNIKRRFYVNQPILWYDNQHRHVYIFLRKPLNYIICLKKFIEIKNIRH